MKLITLNIWGGKIFKPLIEFLKRHADNIDIFCFQEVFHTTTNITESNDARTNTLKEISDILPDHIGYFTPEQNGFNLQEKVNFDLVSGNATFIRKTTPVLSNGNVFVYGSLNSMPDLTQKWNLMPRSISHIQFQSGNTLTTVFNFHGLWNNLGKMDTNSRLQQSQKINDYISKFQNSNIILCGDFNLLPETKSLSMLEVSMKNLIKEYNITSTRSSYYTKPNKFADYILVSPHLKVNDFQVLQDEVSDHLPLFLDFE